MSSSKCVCTYSYVLKFQRVFSSHNSMYRTYWMNRLQSLDAAKHGQILVTMNPLWEPAPETVVQEFDYTHPLYNAEVRFDMLVFFL